MENDASVTPAASVLPAELESIPREAALTTCILGLIKYSPYMRLTLPSLFPFDLPSPSVYGAFPVRRKHGKTCNLTRSRNPCPCARRHKVCNGLFRATSFQHSNRDANWWGCSLQVSFHPFFAHQCQFVFLS